MIYIARNGETSGPFTEPDFREKIFKNEIHPDDHYWQEGFTDWKPVSEYRITVNKTAAVGWTAALLPAAVSAAYPRNNNASARNTGILPVSAKAAATPKKKESPATIGGLCAIAAAFAPLLSPMLFILLSLPLLLAAFVLSIVSIARGKITGGILLLIGVMFAFAASVSALTDRDKILHYGGLQTPSSH